MPTETASGVGILIVQLPERWTPERIATLSKIAKQVIEEHYEPREEGEEAEADWLALSCTPCAPEKVAARRSALEIATREAGASGCWYFQVETQLESTPDDEDSDEDEESASWTNGPLPRLVTPPFPIDGYRDAIDNYTWYDFGIAVKLSRPIGDVLGSAFLQLWLHPYNFRFRNCGVTIDPVNHAIHFWVDRFQPDEPEALVEYPKEHLERTRRFLAISRVHAPQASAIYLNLVCLYFELDEFDAAYGVMEEGIRQGHVGPAEFTKEPYIKALTSTDRFKALCESSFTPATRPDNFEAIELWRSQWMGGLGINDVRVVSRDAGPLSSTNSRLRFIAKSDQGVLALYSTNGSDEDFARSPVVFLQAGASPVVLGDDVLEALAVIACTGFEGHLDEALREGATKKAYGPLQAWLSKYGVSICEDVVATVAAATQRHADVVRQIAAS
jgi:hypothetical protein